MMPPSDGHTHPECDPTDICLLQWRAAGAKSRLAALVAQLDRVLDYESRGRGFESSPAHHRSFVQRKASPFAVFHRAAVALQKR